MVYLFYAEPYLISCFEGITACICFSRWWYGIKWNFSTCHQLIHLPWCIRTENLGILCPLWVCWSFSMKHLYHDRIIVLGNLFCTTDTESQDLPTIGFWIHCLKWIEHDLHKDLSSTTQHVTNPESIKGVIESKWERQYWIWKTKT